METETVSKLLDDESIRVAEIRIRPEYGRRYIRFDDPDGKTYFCPIFWLNLFVISFHNKLGDTLAEYPKLTVEPTIEAVLQILETETNPDLIREHINTKFRYVLS